MKLRLDEVWCLHDEFRSQHSPSHSFIDTGLLSTYYAYNCSLWYHISSRESISRYDIGVLFIISTQQVGTSTAALSWLEEVDDDDGVCGVCSAMAGASYIPTPTSTSLLVHIYIGIHSTFFGRISMCTDRERAVSRVRDQLPRSGRKGTRICLVPSAQNRDDRARRLCM